MGIQKLNKKYLVGMTLITIFAVFFVSLSVNPGVINAQGADFECMNGTVTAPAIVTPDTACAQHGGPKTITGDLEADCKDGLDPQQCGITAYLFLFIRGMTAIVGIVVVTMLVVGGIQYSASGGNPNALSSATKRISNALIALVVYIFMFALLQWLVPGGVF